MEDKYIEHTNRPCFVCGQVMIEDYPMYPHNPLASNWLSATYWTSIGNWCSSVLDCAVDTFNNCKKAHIVICDECFKQREDRIVQIQYTEEERQEEELRHKQSIKMFKEDKDEYDNSKY